VIQPLTPLAVKRSATGLVVGTKSEIHMCSVDPQGDEGSGLVGAAESTPAIPSLGAVNNRRKDRLLKICTSKNAFKHGNIEMTKEGITFQVISLQHFKSN
jgi:hypothetical protein